MRPELFLCLVFLKVVLTVTSRGLHNVLAWKQIDFAYPNPEVRKFAIDNGDFVPENINPLGVAASGSRVFVTMPRWRSGVPATLATVRFPSASLSPSLHPYPDWSWNRLGNCDGITSVYRVKVDECGRLWVLDTGKANSQRVCPAQVLAFDLATDSLVHRFRFPQNVLKEDTQPVSVEVEYPAGQCGPTSSAVLYVADVNEFALIVVSLENERAWRVQHRSMYPSSEHGVISIVGENLELMDGTIGLALSPPRTQAHRTLYYYPLSGSRQSWVRTDILRNETAVTTSTDAFQTSVGHRAGPAASCSMDSNGVLFFGLLNQNALACWNSKKHFVADNVISLAQNASTMQFIGTTTVDHEGRLWVISTRLHRFFLGTQQPREINFRIFMANSTTAFVRGTGCDRGPPGNPYLLYPNGD